MFTVSVLVAVLYKDVSLPAATPIANVTFALLNCGPNPAAERISRLSAEPPVVTLTYAPVPLWPRPAPVVLARNVPFALMASMMSAGVDVGLFSLTVWIFGAVL